MKWKIVAREKVGRASETDIDVPAATDVDEELRAQVNELQQKLTMAQQARDDKDEELQDDRDVLECLQLEAEADR